MLPTSLISRLRIVAFHLFLLPTIAIIGSILLQNYIVSFKYNFQPKYSNYLNDIPGDSFEKVVADYTIKNGQPQGSTLTGLARVKGIPIVETIDTKILDASIKNNEIVTDEVTFLENEVQKGIQDNNPLPPGNYVIKGSIIKVDEEGNVSRAL